MAKLISKTYGDALLEVAAEQNSTDDMLAQVVMLKQVLGDNPDFEKLINNPRVDMDKKAEIVKEVFDGRLSDELTGFLLTVVSKGRFPEIHAILDYFTEEAERIKGIGTAYVTTPMELSPSQKQSIEKRLLETTPYSSMKLDYTVDESLIGGMRIRIGDRVVDSSISTKLSQLKHDLLNTTLE